MRRKNLLLLFALLAATIFMAIGYASVNSITGEISGKATAKLQDDVFITNVEYESDNDAVLSSSNIQNYVGTMMKSTIKLSDTNADSSITYKVTVYNSSDEDVPFTEVIYGNEFYDNENIVFELSGFTIGQTIGPKETKDILITFKYKDGTIPDNQTLNSYLNFKLKVPNRIMAVNNWPNATDKFLTGTVTREKIEKVSFKKGKEPETTVISKFDASEKQDESIIGYYTDTDNNGLYELTFMSDDIIYTNKNVRYMFGLMGNLINIDFDNFSTLGTKSFYEFLVYCVKLPNIDFSKFDTSKTENMSYMFDNCTNLNKIDLSNIETQNVTNMGGMFNYCKNLTELNLRNFDTSRVIEMYSMFYGCNQLTSLDLSNFDTSNVIDMSSMFSYCSKLTSLNLNNFDTSNVTDMRAMFYGSQATTLDVSNFYTSKVTNMSAMFYRSQATKLDLSNFNTSNVTDMSYMFTSSPVATLDLSSFDTSKVIDMSNMFADSVNLKAIYSSNKFNTNAVTSSTDMFSSCSSLVGGAGTKYDSTNVDKTYARIDGGTSNPGYFTAK